MSKHEDELEANCKTIESMDSRILELEENQKEWDKEKAQLQSQRDCYKKERDEERESHSQTKKELAKAKEQITKLQESKEAKELSEQPMWTCTAWFWCSNAVSSRQTAMLVPI